MALKVEVLVKTLPAADASLDLTYLAQKFADADISVIHMSAPPIVGQKDSGFIVALQIAALSTGSVSGFISVLQFWLNQRPQYSISLKRGDSTLVIDRLSAAEAENFLAKAKNTENVLVEIHRK